MYRKVQKTKEMSTENIDLPPKIKEKVVEELLSLNYVLDEKNPVARGALGFLYRTRSTIKKDIGACKVIVISSDLPIKEKEDMLKSIEKEVLKRSKI